MLRLLAPAKVNLTFEALGRRADGYHEARTALQAISLADEISFESAADLSLAVGPPLAGALPSAASVPTGDDNLVMQAARLLRREAGVREGAAIRLRKRIPAAAGLGGGSSDAAAALRGLRRLWGLDLGADALRELAARLGSDVPFFVTGGAALAEGRGERLTPLPPAQGSVVVMASPDETADGKTAALYGLLRPKHYSDGRAADALAQRLRDGAPFSDWRLDLTNAFEAVAPQAYPSYAAMRDAFEAEGMRPLLCGAGPAMFALAPDAPAAAARLRRAGWRARHARFLPQWDAFSGAISRSEGDRRRAAAAAP